MDYPPTTPLFNCPQCHAPVRANDTNCRACGINLALAAVLSERQVLSQMPATHPKAATDLPRFGEFLVSRDYITAEQLQIALVRQREGASHGEVRTLGQTLLDMGAISRDLLEVASIQQMKQLQNALEESNRQLEERVAERTAELQKALSKLTELEELKANFVANISHELRTPLVPLKGYADLLLGESLGPLTPTQKESVMAIGRSAVRLEELVVELIQFASSVKGKMAISPTILSLGDMTDRLTDYFGPKADAANVTLWLLLPPNLPVVKADAEKIYWVLFQLIDNGIKFNRPGGTVTLVTEPRPTTLRIGVRDNGIGIPAEKIPLIFQPFRTDPDDTEQLYEGTGIGLALVKRIVEAHNSKVEVESEPNKGSTFYFELPLLKPQ